MFQEVLHSVRNKRNKNGYMIMKIDLEKAYDCLGWDFIRDTLKIAGFNHAWFRNIMHCVESSSLAILWNGEPLDWFKPSRGIKQRRCNVPFSLRSLHRKTLSYYRRSSNQSQVKMDSGNSEQPCPLAPSFCRRYDSVF